MGEDAAELDGGARARALEEGEALGEPEVRLGAPRLRRSVHVASMGLSDRGGREPASILPPWVGELRASWKKREEARRVRRPLVLEPPDFAVFRDVIVGTTAVFTPPEHDELLGAFDRLALHAVVVQLTGGGVGVESFTAAIETSGDRRHWAAKNVVPEIDAEVLRTNTTNEAFGSDAGATPSLGFVRVRLSLAASTGTPSARVHLYAFRRSQ